MTEESLTSCPFCGKLTIKILHIPFVANTTKSTCRAGGRTTTYQKERFDVLSGCEECGKSQREVKRAFDEGKKMTHEERLERLRKSGLPTRIEG